MSKIKEVIENSGEMSKVFFAYTPQDFKVTREIDTRKPNQIIEKVKVYGDRATVALQVFNGEIRYGVSICDENDAFNRAEGRKRALARMTAGFGIIPLKGFKNIPANINTLALHHLNVITNSIYKSYGKYNEKIKKFEKNKKKSMKLIVDVV